MIGLQDVNVYTEAAIVPSCGRHIAASVNNVCSDTAGTGKGLPGSTKCKLILFKIL